MSNYFDFFIATSTIPCTAILRIMGSGDRLIPTTEVVQHSQPDDCWVVIQGRVWDVTNFFVYHPGGPECK